MSAAATPLLVCHESDPEWRDLRRTGIGASDAPGVLGISPYTSPLKIAADKLGLPHPDGDDVESELKKWGHYVEPAMIRAFQDETGFHSKPLGSLFRREPGDLAFMLATPDGVTQTDDRRTGGLECKLAIFTSDQWDREGVPDHVIAQAQHQMAVMGWDFVFVLALLDGYRLRWKQVVRDDEILGDILIPAERDLWGRIQRKEPIDGFDGDYRPTQSAIRRLYPEDNGKTIELRGNEWIEHLDAWKRQKKVEGEAKKLKERHANALKTAIGANTYAELDDGSTLSLKTTRRDSYVAKASAFRTLRETR